MPHCPNPDCPDPTQPGDGDRCLQCQMPLPALTPAPQHRVFSLPDPQGSAQRSSPVSLALVNIPAGEFWMGSSAQDPLAYPSETPCHRVTIPRSFWISETLITQAQWLAVMGKFKRPPEHDNPHFPMEKVTWTEAVKFCQVLSQTLGLVFRLPTEAEWEYACRAGTMSRYFFGDDPKRLEEYGWYWGNARGVIQPVKTRKANPWGLYDLYGSVWEWCGDQWHSSYGSKPDLLKANGSLAWTQETTAIVPINKLVRVVRGGSWHHPASYCRSAFRVHHFGDCVGIRIIGVFP